MTMSFRCRVAALTCLLAWPICAAAQVFPTRGDTQVTDDADLIDPETEARLVDRLAALRAETGADLAVVTLLSTALYAGGEDVDSYAGQLFDALGLAADPQGRAAMLLIFREDRELRIETGTAYGADGSAAAVAIINDLILPPFQTEDYAAGIEAGVGGIIDRIVAPAAPAASADTPAAGGGGGLWWLLGLIVLPVGGIIFAARRRAAKRAAILAATPCPSCGKTGLTEADVVLDPATTRDEGRGETRTTCPHCGHVTAVPYTIPRLAKDKTGQDKAAGAKPGARDGSKPRGGGASGSW